MNSENGVPFYLIQTIYSLRVKNGMNPSEVARKIGVTVAEYEAWEKDSSDISYEHILKLEEVFQIPSRYIFFGSDITLYTTQKTKLNN